LSITVAVNPLPIVDAGIDQTINIGESAQLQGSASGSLVWTPPTALTNPNTATPFANPLNTTTYTLSATTDKGCAASDSTTVNVTNIFLFLIPNAFSPNADGTNDVFRIVQSKGIKQLQRFAIYNRWGAKIFETNDLQTGWDGTYKGIQQEMGTYVFFIEGTTFLNETYTTKGNVSLIR
jgi:gliding motility-associated-like protein